MRDMRKQKATHSDIAFVSASLKWGSSLSLLSERLPSPQITRRRESPATSASRIAISVLRIASSSLRLCTSIVRSSCWRLCAIQTQTPHE